MKLISWNVNGMRAIGKKGFPEWFKKTNADIISLQEVKSHREQCDPETVNYKGYECFWFGAKKPGYSGTACWSREKPIRVQNGLGIEKFDDEGRVLQLEFEKFILLNCYFPNSQDGGARLPFKIEFCKAIQKFCDNARREKKEVIVCGDYNIAHQEIDLARPKSNNESPGFLPEERAWMTSFVKSGMVDLFREKFPAGDPQLSLAQYKANQYTWWSYRANARANNVGWRIDYHTVSPGLRGKAVKVWHDVKVVGSDHCPVGLELEF